MIDIVRFCTRLLRAQGSVLSAPCNLRSSDSQPHPAAVDPGLQVFEGNLRVAAATLVTTEVTPCRVADEGTEDQLELRIFPLEAAMARGQFIELLWNEATLLVDLVPSCLVGEGFREVLVPGLEDSLVELNPGLLKLLGRHEARHDRDDPDYDRDHVEQHGKDPEESVVCIDPQRREERGPQEEEGDAPSCKSGQDAGILRDGKLPVGHPFDLLEARRVQNRKDGAEEENVEHLYSVHNLKAPKEHGQGTQDGPQHDAAGCGEEHHLHVGCRLHVLHGGVGIATRGIARLCCRILALLTIAALIAALGRIAGAASASTSTLLSSIAAAATTIGWRVVPATGTATATAAG
mmetsp:Transcript_33708/g.73765  ORF Transcript_33708/g.73765 Transcript_33708/m.73765 type:complete len:349 (+) Transcript_33708:61-1107(+)|eukprot:CAMPEP_0170602944 /NCGR_PEP_ID=MMETSP0224-20130122/18658_1 /TAXON_ID=285029 /ORGANISM="Togula jolla, Strain CCCM 725" /LENGTH=348 /DNA_ID=CAMNT_0010927811 /DNA_START=61 /DNA_END=1107 /DNA_ORIENTATION=-